MPTGDQEIIGNICRALATSTGRIYLGVRWATSGTLTNGYRLLVDTNQVNEVRLFRVDAGTSVSLAATDQGFPNADQTVKMRLKATGAGATVTLTYQIDAATELTFNDSNANRKTSGVPAVGGRRNSGVAAVFLDDVTVDDLVAAKAFVPQATMVPMMAM